MDVKGFKKAPITVMVGAGSKLPAIIRAAKNPQSKFYISLVVSHKNASPAINFAIKKGIPAATFKLPDYRKRLFGDSPSARSTFMKTLAWFITQSEYNPKLLVFAGWDLIVDKNFLSFFKANVGNGYAAINLHPSLLPTKKEGDKIKLPDGTFSPIIKGEQEDVLKSILKNKLTYFGPTVHFIEPTNYDDGQVIKREFIKITNKDNAGSLKKKLMPVEDRILVESINIAVSKIK